MICSLCLFFATVTIHLMLTCKKVIKISSPKKTRICLLGVCMIRLRQWSLLPSYKQYKHTQKQAMRIHLLLANTQPNGTMRFYFISMHNIHLQAGTPFVFVCIGCILFGLAVYVCWQAYQLATIVLFMFACAYGWWQCTQVKISSFYITYGDKEAAHTQCQVRLTNNSISKQNTHTQHQQPAQICHMRPVLGGLAVRLLLRIADKKRTLYLFAGKNKSTEWKALLRIVRLRHYVSAM